MKSFTKYKSYSIIVLILIVLYWTNSSYNKNLKCDSAPSAIDCGSERSRSKSCPSIKCNFCEFGSGFFLPRPQGLNSAIYFDPFYYLCDTSECFSLYLGYRYNQTFKDKRTARCLFASDVLEFSGSKVSHHGQTNILADNFGLAPNFKGRLRFDPEIKNNIIDFSVRFDFSNWSECFDCAYLRFNACLVNTSWDLDMCATSQTPTSSTFSNFPNCYMAQDQGKFVPAAQDFNTALSGNFKFGDMTSDWRFGSFANADEARTKTGLANLDIILGYDILRCASYHFGAFIKTVAPTGNRPDPRFVFSPIVGNGHHWEFGGGIDTHVNLWNCDDQCIQLYLNGCVTHLFQDKQWRSFDLKTSVNGLSGENSRYLLLKEFDKDKNYDGHLVNAINFTTRKIKSSFAVQGDAALRILYRSCGWALGVGYNIYGRSRETIALTCNDCQEFANKRVGIKGITGVCALGWKEGEGLTGAERTLNSTESQARIFNIKALSDLVDNPVNVEDPATDTVFLTWDSPSAADTSAKNVIIAQDSKPPVFLTNKDINFRRVARQISHKLFAHIDYQWEECCWQPYLGIYGEVEFAQNGKCHVCTANQWGLSVRSGFTY